MEAFKAVAAAARLVEQNEYKKAEAAFKKLQADYWLSLKGDVPKKPGRPRKVTPTSLNEAVTGIRAKAPRKKASKAAVKSKPNTKSKPLPASKSSPQSKSNQKPNPNQKSKPVPKPKPKTSPKTASKPVKIAPKPAKKPAKKSDLKPDPPKRGPGRPRKHKIVPIRAPKTKKRRTRPKFDPVPDSDAE